MSSRTIMPKKTNKQKKKITDDNSKEEWTTLAFAPDQENKVQYNEEVQQFFDFPAFPARKDVREIEETFYKRYILSQRGYDNLSHMHKQGKVPLHETEALSLSQKTFEYYTAAYNEFLRQLLELKPIFQPELLQKLEELGFSAFYTCQKIFPRSIKLSELPSDPSKVAILPLKLIWFGLNSQAYYLNLVTFNSVFSESFRKETMSIFPQHSFLEILARLLRTHSVFSSCFLNITAISIQGGITQL